MSTEPKESTLRQITVRVPAEIADEMKQVAEKLEKSQTEVWAAAAQQFLNYLKNPPTPVERTAPAPQRGKLRLVVRNR